MATNKNGKKRKNGTRQVERCIDYNSLLHRAGAYLFWGFVVYILCKPRPVASK